MRPFSGSDTSCGSLSPVETLALFLWLLVGLGTLFSLMVGASRVAAMALPL
jgi:hypothetical protein